ncbi:MAG: AarF/ABC1/UbiB kinase family protein [Thiohalocapsa sp.]|nr:AarF/ABC1/UbiB kinase family protein [Thiohalocapsa sp.]MCF7991040.1 AarF/ABC1/UbiB kinase family protein [Thiohalocapsa sp.]
MSEKNPDGTFGAGSSVPSRRLSRLWHLGRATTDLAAGIGLRGMIDMARARGDAGGRIQLTPEATRRFTDRLGRMRGAVMKMGQLMSMDGADVFTPEAAEIMATLRDRAEPMPMSQLVQVLESEWGSDWNKHFKRFEFKPVAAASIGQVHRAETRDGRRLALKVQFPGVRESIDSDIDNIRFLSKSFGMMPSGLDPAPLFDEARRQLHQEADYQAEAAALEAYSAKIGADPDFFVPGVHRDLSTSRILAMDFADGVSVDRLDDVAYTRAQRDAAAQRLTRLLLRELFELGIVQTDPNFGNYLFDADSGRIVLLDFGATSSVSDTLVERYRTLARAAMADDRTAMRDGAVALGYLAEDAEPTRAAALVELMRLSGEILRHHGPYDFAASDLFERVYNRGREMFFNDAFTRYPEPESLFLHRKFVGIFMLCRRLRARVDLRGMLEHYL